MSKDVDTLTGKLLELECSSDVTNIRIRIRMSFNSMIRICIRKKLREYIVNAFGSEKEIIYEITVQLLGFVIFLFGHILLKSFNSSHCLDIIQ